MGRFVSVILFIRKLQSRITRVAIIFWIWRDTLDNVVKLKAHVETSKKTGSLNNTGVMYPHYEIHKEPAIFLIAIWRPGGSTW